MSTKAKVTTKPKKCEIGEKPPGLNHIQEAAVRLALTGDFSGLNQCIDTSKKTWIRFRKGERKYNSSWHASMRRHYERLTNHLIAIRTEIQSR